MVYIFRMVSISFLKVEIKYINYYLNPRLLNRSLRSLLSVFVTLCGILCETVVKPELILKHGKATKQVSHKVYKAPGYFLTSHIAFFNIHL